MKEAYTIKELVALGYGAHLLRKLSRSEVFPDIGFRDGNGRTSTIRFRKRELDAYLKSLEMERS